jgi:deoxyhypusine monooxygenase
MYRSRIEGAVEEPFWCEGRSAVKSRELSPRFKWTVSKKFLDQDSTSITLATLHNYSITSLVTMAPSERDSTPVSTTSSEDLTILSLRKVLCSESVPLARRFRALFSLKHLACQPQSPQTTASIQAIAAAFTSPSALLKHELAYCLGQTKNLEAVPYLRSVLENRSEDAMCRHEAAEALGALGDSGSLDIMKQMMDDEREPTVVRETCNIAIERILWETSTERQSEKLKSSDFASIDPAPPMPIAGKEQSITELKEKLLDTNLPLFTRYRAMFALRDLASPPTLPTSTSAVHALAAGFSDPSALFRHEIAFVFGQLSHPASIPALVACLSKKDEESMVRHEAAEALGSLGDEEGVEDILKGFLNDPEQVVRESVVVALDMAEYEKNGEVEYAIVPEAFAA